MRRIGQPKLGLAPEARADVVKRLTELASEINALGCMLSTVYSVHAPAVSRAFAVSKGLRRLRDALAELGATP